LERLDKNDPEKIENWNLIGRLGSGGMGEVFVASDGVQSVALKVFHKHLMRDQETKSRLQREIDTIEKVKSKHAVKLVSQNLDNDPAWIAMEFINGPDLKAYVEKNGPLTEKDWLILAEGLIKGLKDIHQVNVIHRDIKPSNIILTESGPKIIDFGIAQSVESTSLTKTGLVAGSPAWLSPEQIHGATLTPGTDVFSAGSVLQYAATGNSPWGNQTTNTTPIVLNKILNEEPILTNLSSMQTNLVLRMLNKDVKSRISLSECLLIIGDDSIQINSNEKLFREKVINTSSLTKKNSRRKGLILISIFGVVSLITTVILNLNSLEEADSNLQINTSAGSFDTTAADDLNCAAAENFCVGLVTDIGKVDDKAFNQSAHQGAMAAAAEVSGFYQYIETIDTMDYAANIAQFTDKSYDVIVTVGFLMAEATVTAAKENPNTKFIGVDQFQDLQIANLTSLMFPEDQAGYAAGYLAGLLTKTNQIGQVLAMEIAPVQLFAKGFEAGAKAANASVVFTSVYHPPSTDAFNDPVWGAVEAKKQLAQGADIIFGVGGGTGNGALNEVAKAEGAGTSIFCIGVDTDQWETFPEAQPCLVTSAIKNLVEGTSDLVKAAFDGGIKGGIYFGPIGLADYRVFTNVLSNDAKKQIADVVVGLNNGSILTGVEL
jgi:basic membrane protein A